jgi:flavoprotein family protein
VKKILIIGGGAAGIMTALTAKNKDNEVTIIEKNKTLGQKLSITGGGRCNITNINDREEFFKNIVSNSKFFYKAFYYFSNYDLILFLEEMGIKLSYEKDRVYPQNQSAQKLVNVLTDKLKKQNIRVNLNEKMADIIIKDGMVVQISTDKVDYFLDKDFTHVVLASGGLSYNKNNSFDILKNKVKITPLYPSLVAVNTLDDFSNLSGISLQDVSIIANIDKKTYQSHGSLLFTNKGVSGSAVMDMTAYISPFQDKYNKDNPYLQNLEEVVSYKGEKVFLNIDFLPNLSDEDLQNILFDNSKKKLKTKLSAYIPLKLSSFLLQKYENVDIHNLKKSEKTEIISNIKSFKLQVKSYGSIKSAIVTKGGIDVSEISPSSMRLKKVENLYAVGECIDLDALEGGYNLQIAFSTGHLAGSHLSLD